MKNLPYILSCIKKDVYTFLFYFLRLLVVILLILCVIPLWDSSPAHPPSIRSSTLPLRKIPVFQGVAYRQTNLTLSCVIPLWDSATAHSPSGEKLNCFSGRSTSAYNFHFILRHPSLGLSNSSLTLR